MVHLLNLNNTIVTMDMATPNNVMSMENAEGGSILNLPSGPSPSTCTAATPTSLNNNFGGTTPTGTEEDGEAASTLRVEVGHSSTGSPLPTVTGSSSLVIIPFKPPPMAGSSFPCSATIGTTPTTATPQSLAENLNGTPPSGPSHKEKNTSSSSRFVFEDVTSSGNKRRRISVDGSVASPIKDNHSTNKDPSSNPPAVISVRSASTDDSLTTNSERDFGTTGTPSSPLCLPKLGSSPTAATTTTTDSPNPEKPEPSGLTSSVKPDPEKFEPSSLTTTPTQESFKPEPVNSSHPSDQPNSVKAEPSSSTIQEESTSRGPQVSDPIVKVESNNNTMTSKPSSKDDVNMSNEGIGEMMFDLTLLNKEKKKPPTSKPKYDDDSSSSDGLSNASWLDPMKCTMTRKPKVEVVECKSPPAGLKPEVVEYKTPPAGPSKDHSSAPPEPKPFLLKYKPPTKRTVFANDSSSDEDEKPRRNTRKKATTGSRSRTKKKAASAKSPDHNSSFKDKLIRRRGASTVLNGKDLEALDEIDNDEDKALQVLLWKLGFRLTLMKHQFEGCRGVAGVPTNFPLQQNVVTDPAKITIQAAVKCLDSEPETKGLILADDMGLGKTIQAISGSFLHSAIRKETHKPFLPTLIICPNIALIEQWTQELKVNGVSNDNILYVKARKNLGSSGFNQNHRYIFMTIHTLQAETKDILTECDKGYEGKRNKSCLYPGIGMSLLKKFFNLKLAADGKAKIEFRQTSESFGDCLTRLVKYQARNKKIKPSFGLVVIDEAHFLKNRLSYWGMGTALMGVHADRTVAMTGTPYCNGSSDLAALQSYIDIDHSASRTSWWDKATASVVGARFAEEVSEWRIKYLIRRRKEVILADLLPTKTIYDLQVQVYPSELFVYSDIESKLLQLMEKFSKGDEEGRQQDKDLQDIMMAYMTLARGSLCHPVIPNGREITIQFSPSRKHLAEQHMDPEACVYCHRMSRPSVPLVVTVEDDNDDVLPSGPGLDFDLEDPDNEDDEDRPRGKGKKKRKNKGPLVKLPAEFCCKYEEQGKGGHYIHECCLKFFHQDFSTRCPRCIDLERRMQISSDGTTPLVPHKRYCQNILGGFVASSKIESIVEQFQKVPQGEKVIVLSFFKGALDLLEAIFVHDMNIEVARYDGDVKPELRREELEHFKSTDTCRILLATVNVLGTGLNIIEANHVFFVDRWFNPTVHDQAMDRTYRIGQKKPVSVSFFDCSDTIDIGMMLTNKYKKENSAILLADGSELGEGGLTLRQLNGVMKNVLSTLKARRLTHTEANGQDEPFEALSHMGMNEIMAKVFELSKLRMKSPNPKGPRPEGEPLC